MAGRPKPTSANKYSIDLSRQAERFLRELPEKQARQIAAELLMLVADPSEQLRGYAPMRRLRAGEFRIIFAIEGAVVQVRLIGKRNDDEIYKVIERSLKA